MRLFAEFLIGLIILGAGAFGNGAAAQTFDFTAAEFQTRLTFPSIE